LVRYAVRLLGKLQLQQEPGPGGGGGTSETTAAAAADGPPPPVEEDPTTLLNALYLVRVFIKHLIETTDARQLLEQLQSDAERGTCIVLSPLIVGRVACRAVLCVSCRVVSCAMRAARKATVYSRIEGLQAQPKRRQRLYWCMP
jgi:hypothetical protein